MRLCLPIFVTALISHAVSVVSAETPAWHHPLYLAGDGYWQGRIPLTIHNEGDFPFEGRPVTVRVGTGAGEIALSDVKAESIRLTRPDGVEMLFALAAPDGETIVEGPLPEGSTLVLPATCGAGAEAEYWVYFDNPAAGTVPDFLDVKPGLVNGDMELGDPSGEGAAPAGWRHDKPDAEHRASWSRERPQSGRYCLKTVVADGAEPTWIATRQAGIPIVGGAKYFVRAWVRGENVRGRAGWYLHLGNAENPMLSAPTLSAGAGSFDWKQVTAQFTAPADADRLSLGTVLRGTGTAWFDNVTLECLTPGTIRVATGRPERLSLAEIGRDQAWYQAEAGSAGSWDHRAAVQVFHPGKESHRQALVQVNASTIAARMRGRLNWESILVTDRGRSVGHWLSGGQILLFLDLPAVSMRTLYVYFSDDPAIQVPLESSYSQLLGGESNLVKNASFEKGEPIPTAWTHTQPRRTDGVTFSLDEPGRDGLGSRCVKMHVPQEAPKAWRGWHQTVPIEPGKSYVLAAWVRCKDVTGGAVRLHAHQHTADGKLCSTGGYLSAGEPIEGTSDWTYLSGLIETAPDAAQLQLHLTMDAAGTVWHDGVLVAEVVPGRIVRLEARPMLGPSAVALWPVPAVEKVFPDTPHPREVGPASISLARNEKEPLQVAVRAGHTIADVRVEVEVPTGPHRAKLVAVDIAIVGSVPIDHATSYYRSETPTWERKFPTRRGSCDGWPGDWPDPLLPRDTFNLEANRTQAIWITVTTGRDAASGDYHGRVRLRAGDRTVAEMPFGVHVWDFSLPDENHLAAIYDVRIGRGRDFWGGSQDEIYPQIVELMARNRLCPDAVWPEPRITYQEGRAVADFTEFDRAAEHYFNELKLPLSYTPRIFYLFGWGHPPKALFGQRPYEGEPPYEGVDRSRLRPEFTRAYQACLKTFWDHLKEKGWEKKFILYISDEPHFRHPHIVQQMKALCRMIHEVVPEVPIYSSTWSHLPDWDDSLDVWGISHYGRVPVEEMAELQAGGSRIWFTTDGQMCTDTPYCAVERLLPHYCFKYGAEAYEFWGVAWLTYNPFQYGWHAYIHQSSEPGTYYWVRYPNGDGFLLYPGSLVGHDGPVTSIRFEQAREGVEDFEYLYLLRSLVEKVEHSGGAAGAPAKRGSRPKIGPGEEALRQAAALVEIPNAGGRYSSQILPDPMAVYRCRQTLAEAIEELR